MADEDKVKNSKAPAPKVFDVAPPNKSAPTPTSRPIIVGHGSMIQQDPMVASEESKAEAPKETLEKPKREVVLQPMNPAIEDSPAGSEASPEPEEEVAESAPDNNSDDESLASAHKETTQENAAVDAIIGDVNTKKEREKEEAEQAKRDSEVAELAASKKYYVKIQTPASKRKMRLLVVLIVVLILAGAGWYFAVGPGVKMWNKPVETAVADPPANASATQKTEAKPAEKATNATFADTKLGIAFSHPSDWKVAQTKDTEFPTRDVVTLTSPVEKLSLKSPDGKSVETEVFLRTRIFVENTVNPHEYASDLAKMTSCSGEDVTVGTATMKLLLVDFVKPSPNVSQISLSTDNCIAAGALFNANDQIQFPSKKNTYVIYAEYVLSEAHLQKLGTTTKEAIATAQSDGVVMSKDEFKKGVHYQKFTELIKSLREEQLP